MSKFEHNKMRKTKALLGDSQVRSAIPKTVMFSKKSLGSMLERYGTVYVKPNVGALGVGVMRVRQLKKSGRARYEWRYKLYNKRVSTIQELYQLIRSYKKSGKYLVQRGIHLMKYKGRSFDLRVVTQRMTPNSAWRVTGMLARVAAKGKIVTNGSQGATIHPFGQVFGANLSGNGTAAIRSKVSRLALRIAHRYAIKYPSCIELGLDVAVDNKRRAWLLEVNTKPQIKPFTKLSDRSMYRKILAYRKNK